MWAEANKSASSMVFWRRKRGIEKGRKGSARDPTYTSKVAYIQIYMYILICAVAWSASSIVFKDAKKNKKGRKEIYHMSWKLRMYVCRYIDILMWAEASRSASSIVFWRRKEESKVRLTPWAL